MPSTSQDEYPISPTSTTTSSTGPQHADAQSEPNPACWGAVYTGADWSRHSHQLQLRLHKNIRQGAMGEIGPQHDFLKVEVW